MVLRIVLGAVCGAMAVGQLVSWPHMPDILVAYWAVAEATLPWLAAALAGTSRETTTKILGEFAERSLIKLGRGRITVYGLHLEADH